MEATDRSNGTPLAYAAKGQHTEICKLLLENGWSLKEELKQAVFAVLQAAVLVNVSSKVLISKPLTVVQGALIAKSLQPYLGHLTAAQFGLAMVSYGGQAL